MRVLNLGRRPFALSLAVQEAIFKEKVSRQKTTARASADPKKTGHGGAAGSCQLVEDTIIVVEHSSPIFTVGRRDTTDGLLSGKTPVVKLRRGGGLTYHGPGQITVYPIVNVQMLWRASPDRDKGPSPLRWYSDVLEAALVGTCHELHLPCHGGCTGAWIPTVGGNSPPPTETSSLATSCPMASPSKSIPGTKDSRKVGSIGLQLSDWVSMHGVNLNVTNDPIAYFDQIVMCEQPDRRATSIERERADRMMVTDLDGPRSMEVCGRLLVAQIIRRLRGGETQGEEMDLGPVPDEELVAACMKDL